MGIPNVILCYWILKLLLIGTLRMNISIEKENKFSYFSLNMGKLLFSVYGKFCGGFTRVISVLIDSLLLL